MKDFAVTTTDNPYDPFDQYEMWLEYDHLMGYYSAEYLCNLVGDVSKMEDDDANALIEAAIDEMIEFDLTGVDNVHFKKVVKESKGS